MSWYISVLYSSDKCLHLKQDQIFGLRIEAGALVF